MRKSSKVKDFLQDHMDMLRIARLNVRQVQDRYKKFADQKRRPIHFQEGDQVFLKVLENSPSLKNGSRTKIVAPILWTV